jgi:L-aminopeptidase/D-esterase-like protein
MASAFSGVAPSKATRRFVTRLPAAAALALACCIPTLPAEAATGPNNAITDVPGILVGHSTRIDALTGTTAIIFPKGAKMGFEPSGGAPGDRLSSLLTATHQDSQRVVFNGVVLSGGSVYGLDTVCGVNKWLRQQGLGWGEPKRPFVPGAIVFDLGRGAVDAPPGKPTATVPDPCYDGYYAASHAASGPVQEGSVGGGTGARSGGLKSGFGTASVALGNGIWVGAAVVVNSSGRAFNDSARGHCELYTLFLEEGDEFNGVRPPTTGCTVAQSASARHEGGASRDPDVVVPGNNTTIGLVATNANLTAGQLERMAIMAGDGMARAIRPAHGNGDGDTVFAASTAESPGTVQQSAYVTNTSSIYNAAADAYARAIDHAVLKADPKLGTTYCTRYPTACPEGPPASGLSLPPNAPDLRTTPPAHPAPASVPEPIPAADGHGVGGSIARGIVTMLAALLLAGAVLTRRSRVITHRARHRIVLVTLGAVVLVGATATVADARTGPKNAITDVPGIEVGHSTRADAATGTTSLIFRHGSIMGYDSPGGAPIGHLETLLDGQHEDSQRVVFHGLVLSGGDVYGLDTICGTIKYLDEQGLGYSTPRRPHVPGGAIYDLGRGRVDRPPGTTPDPCADGYAAASNASNGAVAEGSVGAGTGALVGDVKGGVGTASTVLPDGTIIGALVVVNSSGQVYNAAGDCGLYALGLEQNDEFGSTRTPPQGCGKAHTSVPARSGPAEGDTVGVIATNQPLTASQTQQLARAGTEGQGYAIRPAHGTDGDQVFAVTLPADVVGHPSDPASVVQTAWVEPDRFNTIYRAAADTYARAIEHAVLAADPSLGTTYCEKFPNAKCTTRKRKGAVIPVAGSLGGSGALDVAFPLGGALIGLMIALLAFTRRGRTVAHSAKLTMATIRIR